MGTSVTVLGKIISILLSLGIRPIFAEHANPTVTPLVLSSLLYFLHHRQPSHLAWYSSSLASALAFISPSLSSKGTSVDSNGATTRRPVDVLSGGNATVGLGREYGSSPPSLLPLNCSHQGRRERLGYLTAGLCLHQSLRINTDEHTHRCSTDNMNNIDDTDNNNTPRQYPHLTSLARLDALSAAQIPPPPTSRPGSTVATTDACRLDIRLMTHM